MNGSFSDIITDGGVGEVNPVGRSVITLPAQHCHFKWKTHFREFLHNFLITFAESGGKSSFGKSLEFSLSHTVGAPLK